VKADFNQLWNKIHLEDDAKAFERLYYAMFNKLIKFSVHYVNHKEVAEEIVSEVFVNCWKNRKEMGDVQNPESYLYIAVRNQSLKHCRKFSRAYMVELDENEFRLTDFADPSKKIERKELHRQLDEAIETLPAQARMIFRMIKENGLKYKEVAQILNISPRTVQTQLFRAIAKLRDALKTVPEKNGSGKILGLYIIFVCLTKFFLKL
jgi:RNA polymerase sigma-70 factor (family 1)